MPALEMAQETGKLVSWRKQEGQTVAKGEPLLEIETDKAVMEIEAPGDGVLAAVKAQPGDEVPVGQTIAWLSSRARLRRRKRRRASPGRHMSARPESPHLPTAADVGHEAALPHDPAVAPQAASSRRCRQSLPRRAVWPRSTASI